MNQLGRCIYALSLALAFFQPAAVSLATANNSVISQTAGKKLAENWSWQFVGNIQGLNSFDNIIVDPEDESIWYVISLESGLFVTRDNGASWTHAISGKGLDAEGLQIDPANPNIVYAAVWDKLYKSTDRGVSWNVVYTSPEYIRSVLVSAKDGAVYLGPQTESSSSPGLYKSTDGGVHFTVKPFGVNTSHLICWDIAEDATTGILYVPIELANHPQPYNPPLFRSADGGDTWENIAFTGWHAQKMAVEKAAGDVYFLVEGGSLYRSKNHGDSWKILNNQPLFYFLVDAVHPGRFFGGSSYESGVRGAWMSENGGRAFSAFGLDDLRVTGLALNGDGTTLYASTWGNSIWKTNLPEYVFSPGIRVANTLDAGLWSLREAIHLANKGLGADTIRFDIPKEDPGFDALSGTWTILVSENLPAISDDSLFIDGYSQRENRREDLNPDGPEIVLTPVADKPSNAGLLLLSGYNQVSHLIINSFNGPGISLNGPGAKFNVIVGSYIGTDGYGEVALPNQFGIYLSDGNHNRIGSLDPMDRNVLSGNINHGLVLAGADCSNNVIEGNSIGLTPKGQPRGNGSHGIFAGASGNTISRNEIAFNGSTGIAVLPVEVNQVTITQNSIHDNLVAGILLMDGANNGIQPPVLSFFEGAVYGDAAPGATVELFSDQAGQGAVYEGNVTADVNGAFVWDGSMHGPYITATATDTDGNTSEFSNAVAPLVSGSESVFPVTNTRALGDGSLAAAIENARNASGRKRIIFQIPKSDPGFNAATGVWSIKPTKAYIPDTDSLTIDGRTQKEFIGEDTNLLGPEIAIDGASIADPGSDGLLLWNGDGFAVYDLAIFHFLTGISIRDTQGGVIAGCYIGTDEAGEDSLGNDTDGIYLHQSQSIIIGGQAPEDGNVILGSSLGEVYLSLSSDITIRGNHLGVNRRMQKSFANQSGTIVSQSSENVTIADNVIGGSYTGLTSWKSSGLMIRNNYINIKPTWESIGHLGVGVWLSDSSHDNIVANNNIGFCDLYAIGLQDGVQRCKLTQNQVHGNGLTGIYIDGTSNNRKKAPTLLSANPVEVKGQADPGDLVEIFNDSDGQARLYLGTTTADGSGFFSLLLSTTPQLKNITATATDGDGNSSVLSAPIEIQETGVDYKLENTPSTYYLAPNFPNPFNPTTSIRFGLKKKGLVDLRVFNLRGEEVALLLHQNKPAGEHQLMFNAGSLPSGVYLLRLTAGEFKNMRKMLLVR